MAKLLSIALVRASRVSIILLLNILYANVAVAINFEDKTILESIQNNIESGNLSQATKLLEQIEDSNYKRALEANIAARVGDYEVAISLYHSLIDQFDGKDRYRLVWNYIQLLRERAEYYDWQLSLEYDSSARQSLQELIESDQNLALSLARNYQDDLTIAILLWQMSPRDTKSLDKVGQPSIQQADCETDRLTQQGCPTLSNFHLGEVERNPLRGQTLKKEDSGLKVELLLGIGEIDEAINVAQRLNEPRFLSWAYGEQGKKLLEQGQVEGAIASFETARLAANQAQDYLALARWQGYLGSSHVMEGNVEKAKLSYEVAVNAIKDVRKAVTGYRVDPLLIKQIQPILRDYLVLLLKSSDQESLKKAIEIQKLSSLTELESYFKNLCDIDLKAASTIKSDTAYIYTIILGNRLHLIVQTSEGYLKKSVVIAKSQLDEQLYRWRLALADSFNDSYIEDGRKLYDLLIRPIEPQIWDKKRLVFVQDGLLRTVPMAALIDGEDFLIERYAIAYSLGFKLQEPNQRLKTALVAGSSQTPTEILPSVNQEVALLGKILEADVLSGEQLSPQSLSDKLENQTYNIVHIATRNEIMPNIEQSLFTLGKEEISLREFERMLRSRKGDIAFLSLASCDTATGNSVAVLGLTGIGLRTGIVNTVGSLWGIHDEQTKDFMVKFYRNLQKTEDYDDSLRQAQLDAISNELVRPDAWAGFIVLTNK
jgi:CHAT domain-containing protein